MAFLGGICLCLHGHVHRGSMHECPLADSSAQESPSPRVRHGILRMGGREARGHPDALGVDQPRFDPQSGRHLRVGGANALSRQLWRSMWDCCGCSNTVFHGRLAKLHPGIGLAVMAFGPMDVAHWLVLFTFQAISYVLDVHCGTLKAPAGSLSFTTHSPSSFHNSSPGPSSGQDNFCHSSTPFLDVAKEEDRQHIQMILTDSSKILLGDFIGAWIVDPVFAEPAAWSSWRFGLHLTVTASRSMQISAVTRTWPQAWLASLALPCPKISGGPPGHFTRRLLASLAHHPLCVVEGLRLHPNGWQPTVQPIQFGLLGTGVRCHRLACRQLGDEPRHCRRDFSADGRASPLPSSQSPSRPCHQRVLDHVVGRTLARGPHEFHRLGRPEWRSAERVDCAPTALRKEVGCMAWLAGDLSHCGGFPNLVQGRFPRSHE